MKILLCHNHYQQRGGEDQVFDDERWLLESQGHEVLCYTRHNDDLEHMSKWDVALNTFWNRTIYGELRRLIRRERPEVMHCTNLFPLISPAAYYAAKSEGVAVVQSLHNYRLFCANGLLLRQGKTCEDCVGKSLGLPGIRHACYRRSRVATTISASMVAGHRLARTWTRAIDRYIALSHFSRSKFIQGGLPADKIAVKPNFVYPDPEPGSGKGRYAVTVGRLSEEKGIATLLEAWKQLEGDISLKIVGDGPLADLVSFAAAKDSRITWLGRRPLEEIYQIVGDAACLLQPSICYENCPKTVLEAYAKGTPVIASRIGALQELVIDGQSGLHFEPGSASDLAAKVTRLFAEDESRCQMRNFARLEFENRFTAQANYQQLMTIYRQAMGTSDITPFDDISGNDAEESSDTHSPMFVPIEIEPSTAPIEPQN